MNGTLTTRRNENFIGDLALRIYAAYWLDLDTGAPSTTFSRRRRFDSRFSMHVIAIARSPVYPDDNPLSLKSRRIVGRYECDFQNLLWSFRSLQGGLQLQ